MNLKSRVEELENRADSVSEDSPVTKRMKELFGPDWGSGPPPTPEELAESSRRLREAMTHFCSSCKPGEPCDYCRRVLDL